MIENAYGVMPGTVIRPQEVVEWVSIGGITKIQLRQVPTAQVVQKMFRLASPVLNLSSLASCLLHQKNHKFTELTDGKNFPQFFILPFYEGIHTFEGAPEEIVH